jgi:hypothetical protein
VSGGASCAIDILEDYNLCRMVSRARPWEDHDMSRTGVVRGPSRARVLRRRNHADGPSSILFLLAGIRYARKGETGRCPRPCSRDFAFEVMNKKFHGRF